MSETFDNFDVAANALAGAVSDHYDGSSDESQNQPVPENQPVDPNITQGDQGTPQPTEPAPNEVSFLDSKNIDLSQLSPEQRDFLQAREREMQAAFTQKTQALAEQRQQSEEAVQFLNELNSNPEFAYEVQQRLNSELERLGFNAEAAQDGSVGNEQFRTEEDDPYLAEINELKAWKNEQEQRIREAEAASRIDRETAVIMQQNPAFKEEDMGSIYSLALSFNGDMQRATDAYKGIVSRATNRYLEQKASVPVPLTNQPSATGHAEMPQAPLDLGSKDLRNAALTRLRAAGFE